MSYMYKTILRAENHEFDFWQNRYNSIESYICAFNRKDRSAGSVPVCTINNRTGAITFDENTFKKSTIDKLKQHFIVNHGKKENQTALVKHRPSVKNKVAKAVIGTDQNIGSFYDTAAEEKLKTKQ